MSEKEAKRDPHDHAGYKQKRDVAAPSFMHFHAGEHFNSAGWKEFHEHWEQVPGGDAFRLMLSVRENWSD